jgi:UDP-N-acetylmuramate dehydrogenase
VVTPSPALRDLAERLGARATLSKPLGPLTTYGVGGPAALFVEVERPADLDEVRRALSEGGRSEASGDSGGESGGRGGDDLRIFVIGRGSNLLVSDAGFDGVVVHLGGGFAGLELPDRGEPETGGRSVVRAGGALALPVLARRVADIGWSGLSWAVGVPGSVGGAVRMNAGGHGSDMAACLVSYGWVDLVSDAGGTDDVTRLAYAYRSSSVTPTEVVVEAQLAVTRGSADVEQGAVAAVVKWRREHQPGGSNAGSIFTNPEGDSAGRLIEEAGLKGFRLGTAHVSEKHANFIQADKGGRADDVRALMEHVRKAVEQRCGVQLATEVRLLGFGDGKTGAVSDRRQDGDAAPSRGPAEGERA